VTCAAFDRWLDEGLPEPAAAGARDHAARCARCAAELAAAEAIETGLMRATFTAPAHLTDAVMARVATLEAARVAPAPPSRWSDAFPWWVRAAGDPAAAFAAVLCALLFWKWDAIAGAGVATAAWLANTSTAASAVLPGIAWTAPGLGVQVAFAVLLVPASLWLGRASFRVSEHWMEHAARMSR
jgi:hypothetical protein